MLLAQGCIRESRLRLCDAFALKSCTRSGYPALMVQKNFIDNMVKERVSSRFARSETTFGMQIKYTTNER